MAIFISNILIVVGIVLTAVGTFGNYYYNDKLSEEKDKIAVEEKKELTNKIDTLTSAATSLEGKLKPFETLANTLYPSLKLEEALEKLRQDTITLRERTEKIERQSAPRRIIERQRDAFANSLKNIEKGKVVVHCFMNAGSEANQYANEIRDMLVNAGFDCGKMVAMSLGGAAPKGLFLSVKNKDKYPVFVDPMVLAFQAIGISFQLVINDSIGEDEFEITVGLKPEN